MRAFVLLCIVTCGLLLTAPLHAGDAEAGKAKSKPCAMCHGVDGNSTSPVNPRLAGQYEEALIAAMLAYQEGTRQAQPMQAYMQPLSKQDIEDLAAYYASQPCK
jgi:cytochrome c553